MRKTVKIKKKIREKKVNIRFINLNGLTILN